jgi:hypothetical protein
MFDSSQGVCQDEKDLNVFFSDEDGVYDPKTLAYAKLVCKGCPIKMECRAEGTRLGIEGVWGGLTEKERVREARAVARRKTPPSQYAKDMAKAANKERSLLASDASIPIYKQGLEKYGSGMPKEFRVVVEARINYPELSLAELGALLGTSKDGVAGKLRRLKDSVLSGKSIIWEPKKGRKYGPRKKAVLN